MSDISFTCAKCGQHLSIEAAAAGEEITCPTCGAPQRVPAPPARAFTYWAFISYSSRDRKWAEWLHRAIETFGVPAGIAGRRTTPSGHPAPRRFHPVFRDRDELPASADLGARIRQALEVSNHLIVVCSPHAARSRWVNKEIDEFVALGRQDRVLSILVDGEPNTGDERECFPPALRGIEPIAADARPGGDGKRNAMIKLLAGMLGVNFDALRNRDRQRRRKTRAVIWTGICLSGALLLAAAGASLREKHRADRVSQTAGSQRYASGMREVQRAWEDGDTALVLKLLEAHRPAKGDPNDLRGFEWYYWWGQTHREILNLGSPRSSYFHDLSFSPDGRRIVAVAEGDFVEMWDAASGNRLFAADAAPGSDEDVETPRHNRLPHGKNLNEIAFGPDGRLATAAEDGVAVWDAAEGKPLLAIREARRWVRFHPDGTLLASVNRNNRPRLWDSVNGREVLALQAEVADIRQDYNLPVGILCFSGDGERIAIGNAAGDVTVCGTKDGRAIMTLSSGGQRKEQVLGVHFDSGDALVAVQYEDFARLVFDAASGKKVYGIRNERGESYSLAFGRHLATADFRGIVRVWDAWNDDEGEKFVREKFTIRGPVEPLTGVCFSPDGKRLAASADDGFVRVWEAAATDPRVVKLGTWGAQRAVMSGDGRCLAAFLRDQSGGSTELNIRPDGNGESWVPVPGVKHTDGIFMSPDGNRIALTNSNDHPFVIEIRDARGGGKLQTITTPEKAPHILCLSPDGSRLAVAECSRDFRGLRVFDAVGGSPLYTVATTSCFANCSFCFSPDGARLAAVTDEDGLFILDAANGRRLLGVARPRIYSRECSICYDTAGRRIAVGDSAISVLDAGSGREITRLTGRNKGETCVSFSPDGRRLAAAGDAEGLSVWDLPTGQEILTFELGGKPGQICFNADGTRLSALVGGSLLQWEAPRERKPR